MTFFFNSVLESLKMRIVIHIRISPLGGYIWELHGQSVINGSEAMGTGVMILFITLLLSALMLYRILCWQVQALLLLLCVVKYEYLIYIIYQKEWLSCYPLSPSSLVLFSDLKWCLIVNDQNCRVLFCFSGFDTIWIFVSYFWRWSNMRASPWWQ